MSTFSTHDLRSGAKSYQRDKNHSAKWERGAYQVCQQHSPADANCPKCFYRPNRRGVPKPELRVKRFGQQKINNQALSQARKVFKHEVVDAMGHPSANLLDASSGDEDIQDASEAPIPAGADFMYNYDTPTGPHAGKDVLSHAITQAVRRFENNETEKLVNKEYDVVSDKDANEGYSADDDDDLDFEIVEHSHLA